MNNLKEKLTTGLKLYLSDQGADLIGMAPVERFGAAPQGHKPQDFLPQAKSVVVIGVRLIDSLVLSLPKTRHLHTENFYIVNDELNVLADKAARFLSRQGFESLPIFYSPAERADLPSQGFFADISYRHAGVVAGLGRIGRNQLLITPQFGPRVRLIMVLTSARLILDEEINKEICDPKRCSLSCLKNCPPKALRKDGIDKSSCYQYMFETLKGLRCGMCIAACPIGIE